MAARRRGRGVDVVRRQHVRFRRAGQEGLHRRLLEASDLKGSGSRTQKVVAVGCLAERYGQQLVEQLPEADAVLGFDSYRDMSTHLQTILGGGHVASHTPSDRRTLLPLSPVERRGQPRRRRPARSRRHAGAVLPQVRRLRAHPRVRVRRSSAPVSTAVPGHPSRSPAAATGVAPSAPSRCSGAFVSRRPADVITEGGGSPSEGVGELFLVSENSTSYGKDLDDLGLLEKCCPS